MFRPNLRFAAAAGVAGLLAMTGSASAQTGNPFSCSASTAAVSVAGLPVLAPTTANPSVTPCASDTTTLGSVTVPTSNPTLAVAVAVGPVDSTTRLSTSKVTGATVDTEANATTTVRAATLNLAGHTISIGPSTATVDERCVSGALQASAGSTLNAITIDGTTETLTGHPQSFTLPGVATIAVNQRTTSGTSRSETLLDVDVLGAVGGGASITIGTAEAGATAGACAGTTTSSGDGGGGTSGGGSGSGGGAGGGASSACPSGAVSSSGGCVVSGTTIAVPATSSHEIVGAAQVMSLSAARRRFGRHVSCLNGAGPKFVVVGTKRADRITVRNKRMRVLGLGGNDHITVIGGNRTCVNGGAGNDVIVNTKKRNDVTAFGSNGNDRITLGNGPGFVLGGKGNDTIVAGNGRVNLQGNRGNDHLTAGNGAARLNGGNGNDVLVAGTGRAHLNGGKGRNRLTAHGRIAYVQASRGSDSVAYVRRRDVRYARRHGVRRVHVLR